VPTAAPAAGPRTRPELLLVHGDDRHRVDEAVRGWRRQAADAELGVEVVDPPAPLDRIRSCLAEVPLIDPRRYLLIRDPPQLAGGRRSGEAGRALAAALELRAPSTSVCLASHVPVPPSHPVAAAVTRLGGETRAFTLLRGREVRVWAERAAADRGLRLAPGGLDHLLRVAGSDLGVVSAELDKLAAFAGGGPVDLETARRVVGGAEAVEVWGVLERLLGAQPGRGAATALDLVDEGRSTQHLIATLAGQLSELRRAQFLLAEGGSATRLAGQLHIPEWRADRLARQARAISAEVVEDWLHQLQAIDVAIKAGEADDRQAMGRFSLGAARAVARGRAGGGEPALRRG
jgi:DNA polymerase-3 subunit delta